jgi:hypothetical protein
MTERQRVVISDIHGQSELLERVVKTYGDDAHYIFAGDFIDRGPDSKGVLDIMKGLNTSRVFGNHEFVAVAALTEARKHERTHIWAWAWLNDDRRARLERNFLSNYGYHDVKYYHEDSLFGIKETLKKLGHYRLLLEESLYYEDDDLIVTHAGLKPEFPNWARQKADLDEFDRDIQENHLFRHIPAQTTDHNIATLIQVPYDTPTGRTIISGHAHLGTPLENRTRPTNNGGQRVFLASRLDQGDPLYVYDVEDKKVREFK